MLRERIAHPPRHLVRARSQVPRLEQIASLVRNIEKEFGTVARVPGGEEVPGAVADYLAGQNLPSHLVMAPHPELRTLPWSARPLLVIREGRVVGAYEDAWDLLRAERQDPMTGGFMPRNIMLVTGPSRSADIEQTLELGAHGPRRLHVVLIEDDPAAARAAA